jgi:hypothetical protein
MYYIIIKFTSAVGAQPQSFLSKPTPTPSSHIKNTTNGRNCISTKLCTKCLENKQHFYAHVHYFWDI